MITPLNRVKLFVDSSSEAAANVTASLKAAGIAYDMRTKSTRGAMGRAVTAARGVGQYMGGMASSTFSDQLAYVYTVYVRRKDEARARTVCDLGKPE